MKVVFTDFHGVERRGSVPEEKIIEPFVRLRNVEYGMFTVYRNTPEITYLMLYRPVSPVRPDLVLETYFTEDTNE